MLCSANATLSRLIHSLARSAAAFSLASWCQKGWIVNLLVSHSKSLLQSTMSLLEKGRKKYTVWLVCVFFKPVPIILICAKHRMLWQCPWKRAACRERVGLGGEYRQSLSPSSRHTHSLWAILYKQQRTDPAHAFKNELRPRLKASLIRREDLLCDECQRWRFKTIQHIDTCSSARACDFSVLSGLLPC